MFVLSKAYKLIRKEGVKTGSRVWKVHNKDSDYDYILLPVFYQQILEMEGIKKLITFHDQSESPDYEGNPTFYFEHRGRKINVISPFTIQDYKAWEWATEAMKLVDYHTIRNRDKRVELFKRMRDFFISYIFDDIPF